MATTPVSSGLFLSSSPAQNPSGPSEEVEELLAQARTVEHLDPTINAFLSKNHSAFFETFSRRIALIKSRSQSFHDCHVTVFDKVLLELTQNGTSLNDVASIQYFCEEFLGFWAHGSGLDKTATLSSAVAASMLKNPAVTPPNTQHELFPARNERTGGGRDSEKKSLFGRSLDDLQISPLTALAAQVAPAMPRLWSIYNQAKEEFYAVSDQDGFAKAKAAKFFRDSAENTLQFLQSHNADQRLVTEVEAHLEFAKHTAMALHGGKKRKFDEPEPADDVRYMPPAHVSRSNPKYPRQEHTRSEHESRAYDRVVADPVPSRTDFAGHTRALSYRQRLEEPRRGDEGRRDASDLFPEEREWDQGRSRRKRQQPRTQPGRGHSDIPFGYSRPVDSYQPRK